MFVWSDGQVTRSKSSVWELIEVWPLGQDDVSGASDTHVTRLRAKNHRKCSIQRLHLFLYIHTVI